MRPSPLDVVFQVVEPIDRQFLPRLIALEDHPSAFTEIAPVPSGNTIESRSPPMTVSPPLVTSVRSPLR